MVFWAHTYLFVHSLFWCCCRLVAAICFSFFLSLYFRFFIHCNFGFLSVSFSISPRSVKYFQLFHFVGICFFLCGCQTYRRNKDTNNRIEQQHGSRKYTQKNTHTPNPKTEIELSNASAMIIIIISLYGLHGPSSFNSISLSFVYWCSVLVWTLKFILIKYVIICEYISQHFTAIQHPDPTLYRSIV